MRELKFRVWDKLAKRFIYPDKGYQGHYILSLNGKFHDLQNGSGGDDYEVSQFTGLKDKNGKDIYEGDFVEYGLDNRISVDEVVWEHFGWVLRDLTYYGSIPLTQGLEYKIIGNIFENPELL